MLTRSLEKRKKLQGQQMIMGLLRRKVSLHQSILLRIGFPIFVIDSVNVFVNNIQDWDSYKENEASPASKFFGPAPLLGGRKIKILKRIVPKGVGDFRSGSIQIMNKPEDGVADLPSFGEVRILSRMCIIEGILEQQLVMSLHLMIIS